MFIRIKKVSLSFCPAFSLGQESPSHGIPSRWTSLCPEGPGGTYRSAGGGGQTQDSEVTGQTSMEESPAVHRTGGKQRCGQVAWAGWGGEQEGPAANLPLLVSSNLLRGPQEEN